MTNLPLSLKEKVKTVDCSLLPQLNKLLLFLLTVASTTQLGKHFWPDSTFVFGISVDYLSPTLYFFDLFLIFYLLFRFFLFSKSSFKFPSAKLLLFLVLNFLLSSNPLSTLSFSLRLILYLTFFLNLSLARHKKTLSRALLFSLSLQLSLALFQFISQHSLNGIFYWLGERRINLSSPNVAKSSLFGRILLRPYGTFSHPNALAGWSLLVFYLLQLLSFPESKPSESLLQTLTKKAFLIFPVFFILLLTQSRLALFVFFFLLIPRLFSRKQKLFYFSLTLLLFLFFRSELTNIITHYPASFLERLKLFSTSFQILKAKPLFGAGLSSSISLYPTLSNPQRLLQPDHNSFTLLFSQIGIFGLLALPFSLLLSLPFFLFPLLFFDHYLITSTQGLFIFLLLWRTTANNRAPKARRSH